MIFALLGIWSLSKSRYKRDVESAHYFRISKAKGVNGMPNPRVKCTVDQCTHYMPGDQCMAAKISVYNDEETGQSETNRETQCKSFHHRKTVGDMVGAFHNSNVGGMVSAAFLDGKQVTPVVECFVNNCKYWDSTNLCNAGSIHVTGQNAAKTTDTDCHTFEKK